MDLDKLQTEKDIKEQEAMPLTSSSASAPSASGGGKQKGMFDRVFTSLYGEISYHERSRVAWLSGTLLFIIGGYWLLRSLKDPIVAATQGVSYIPTCKMVSLIVVFALVFVYNKMLDIMPKHHLFYVFGIAYFILFTVIAMALAHPTIGLDNTEVRPDRYIGLISYCAIESFGSIGVTMFWAFVNSSVDLESAKSSFGLIIAGAQVGAIAGPTLATHAKEISIPGCYFVGALCMAMIVVMMKLYVTRFGTVKKDKKEKKSAGLFEGAKLIGNYPYVFGIFLISCLFMVEVTILDFMMKVLAQKEFSEQYPGDKRAASAAFVAYMGRFGQITNSISLVFSLLGTSFVIRRIGLRLTLLAFPAMCLGAVGLVYMSGTLSMVFFCMIMLKGFSYALNNPTKELLYQPTSLAIKFKAKSWIDIFGARSAKAIGSVVTNALRNNVESLLSIGSLVAMGLSAAMIFNAGYMGKKFDEYQVSGHVVGGEGEGESSESKKEIQMAPTGSNDKV